jgi:hypothetical protein
LSPAPSLSLPFTYCVDGKTLLIADLYTNVLALTKM